MASRRKRWCSMALKRLTMPRLSLSRLRSRLLSWLATTVPLLLFTMAARRIPLGLLGMLQFVSPTLQFLVGWLAYGEPLSPLRLASFALIWAGVGLYVAGLGTRSRRIS